MAIDVQLTDEERKGLAIVRKHYENRHYLRLTDGWTDILFGLFKRLEIASCPYNFHRADIKGNEFKTVAICSECFSEIAVKSKHSITEIHLVINDRSDTNKCKMQFRRVTAHKAKILSQKMKSKTPFEVYHDQSKDIPDDATKLPADFVSQKKLLNIKYRHNSVEGTAIHYLRTMKYFSDGSIKEVATDPLVALFWTKQQIHCYAQTGNQRISFDASGGFIINDTVFTDLRCCLENTPNAQHVFLYLISLKTADGTSVPVGQMISAQQDSTRISYFLDRWLEDFKLPKEVTIDASMALKKSLSKNFASCKNIHEYLTACFDVLMGKTIQALPTCYIRLDVAHYVKNLHSNKIWKKVKKKHFYLCCIGVFMMNRRFQRSYSNR